MKRFLVTLIAVTVTTAALAQTSAPVGTALESVTVSGTGRALVTPDRFSFTVGVQSVANTVDDAVAENNARVAAVIAALKKAGAGEKDIQTSGFNIYPQQDYAQGKLPRILGYQVSNQVTVRSTKVGNVGRLLGVAIAAGVNTSSGIMFEVSDPARGRDQGMRAAFDDARAKAMLLAQAAGRTLGRAVYIREGAYETPPPVPMPRRAMAMEMQATADVPIESGAQENMYTVSVTFELR